MKRLPHREPKFIAPIVRPWREWARQFTRPEILPMVYTQSLKKKLFVVRKIGLFSAIKLYKFEKKYCNGGGA